jgi:hypothetical protein
VLLRVPLGSTRTILLPNICSGSQTSPVRTLTMPKLSQLHDG